MNDKVVTGPVVAVWLRVLPPKLLVGCEMVDVVMPLPLVLSLVADIAELVLWLPLLICDDADEVVELLVLGACVKVEVLEPVVCDGADEVAKLLVLSACVKVEVPEPMVCDVTDEVIVVRPTLLVVICPPVTVPVDLEDSGLVLCPARVVDPVLVACDGSMVVDWLLVRVREDPDGLETVDCPLDRPPVLVVDAEIAEFVVCRALVVCDDWRAELEWVAPVVTWLVPVDCPEAVELMM